MDAVAVLLGLLLLIVAAGGIIVKAWFVNKEAERLKAAEQQA